MSFNLTLSHLYFEYEYANEALFSDVSLHFSTGWTGIVGANGSGKTTLLNLISGHLKPDSGNVQYSGRLSFCEQEVFQPPAGLDDFFNAYDGLSYRLRDNLHLTADMPERWQTLSMGERKKLQIALALWLEPDILCVDEPTNHLDAEGRDLLINELKNYHGTGIVVSHDRELLDILCSHCAFLEHGNVNLRSGGYSAGRQLALEELENLLEKEKHLKKEVKRSKRELQRRRQKEQEARNRNTKSKLEKHDNDGRNRINAARLTGRDRHQGDLAKSQLKVVSDINAELSALGKTRKQRFSLKIPYGCYSARAVLLNMAAGIIPLGKSKLLNIPELFIGNHDRIALTGINGSGKSTLLRKIVADLKLSDDEYLYLPQELSGAMCREIYAKLQLLSNADFGQVMKVVASLGSIPERVLDSENCSPGEWRKLFFGLGVLRQVNLIIMDEPTNHLDLPSIECLESALNGCDSALLLISHDQFFLKKLCDVNWHIESGNAGENLLKKQYF